MKKNRKAQSAQGNAKSTADPLYKPLDSILVRAPLLPIEAYLGLHHWAQGDAFESGTLLPRNPLVQQALAVGSSALLRALEQTSPESRDAARLQGKLLRFLIRMSTRPTPYGLFAGVALGQWGETTDLTLAATAHRTRTRLDMGLLMQWVMEQEAQPQIRQHLRWVANPAAFLHAGRVFLAERAPTGTANSSRSVSVRATGVVKRTLDLARTPILYQELVAGILASSVGAIPEKVAKLLTELWQQTLLFTDLRPPLTTDNPAQYVMQRLSEIPAAQAALAQLTAMVQAAAAWDSAPPEQRSTTAYRDLAKQTHHLTQSAAESSVQVDMAMALEGTHLVSSVGDEVARAAELLLRLTPFPNGLSQLTAYHRAFVSRYGSSREVPLLELLDPQFGLGSPYANSPFGSGIRNAVRSKTLLDLACHALHQHTLVVELDPDKLARLSTCVPATAIIPPTLDINVFIAAPSSAALDTGKFQVIIGPNLGASSAGRNLGRFADLLGPDAQQFLEQAVRAEERQSPSCIWAELVYAPRRFRSANVLIRPSVRTHEITLGAAAGVDDERVIPLNELVVGVRKGRFYLRWPTENKEVAVCAGHMLNTLRAPTVCRFLSDLSREGTAQLSPFDWGPAANFPFLPRVQVGRIVLRPAQWRIDWSVRKTELSADTPEAFWAALKQWREDWQVPQYVYLSAGDNRLLLDLEHSWQVEELRLEVRRLGERNAILLQEVLPGLDQIWTSGPEGHFVTEFVVPLALREDRIPVEKEVASAPASTVPLADRLRPPGSDWLFIKLYGARFFSEDLIAGPVRLFTEEVQASGLVEKWFFLRYSDPEPHLRLRFRGNPEQLMVQLLPKLCTWASGLMTEGLCKRFSFDTYDREIERYGGIEGIELAESLFAIDSRTVAELLYGGQGSKVALERSMLAVLSVDQLLAGIGLTEADRLQWLQRYEFTRNTVGPAYRQSKKVLRSLLQGPEYLSERWREEALVPLFAIQKEALNPIAMRLSELEKKGELSQPLSELYSSFVHLHCNRLLGTDPAVERMILGLLLRTREGLAKTSGA
jgi:thiopeptide-type bacteriocin biosynthesis protein